VGRADAELGRERAGQTRIGQAGRLLPSTRWSFQTISLQNLQQRFLKEILNFSNVLLCVDIIDLNS